MAKGTEKMGSAGRMGARYGVVVRKLTRDIEKIERSRFECPTCHHTSVKRKASGIWQCRHCDAKFAAGSYAPTIKSITTKELEMIKEKEKPEGGV